MDHIKAKTKPIQTRTNPIADKFGFRQACEKIQKFEKTGIGFYAAMCYYINITADFEDVKKCNHRHILKFEVGAYEKDTFSLISRSFSNYYPDCFCG
ncbi:MAG: hypothetical protein GY774_14640 [Planctomycetes bacterium]|nr:hypothetical protein [Planctomycetota bacterium]